MDRTRIKEIMAQAIDMVKSETPDLFRGNVAEVAVCARLARYLEDLVAQELTGFHADVEFNRVGVGNVSKRNDRSGNIRLDINVHRRTQTDRDSNLIAILAKKSKNYNKRKHDRWNVVVLTNGSHPQQIEYQFGVFLTFSPNGVFTLEWDDELQSLVSSGCLTRP